MIHVPALPSPTHQQALVVNATRDELNSARAWTLRAASPAVLADLFDSYARACIAAGVPTPPPLSDWPAPEFGIKSPGDQRRATDRSMTR